MKNSSFYINELSMEYHFWNEREIGFLKENYKSMTYKEIGKILNRSVNAVKIKASRRLHLKKPSSGNYLKMYRLSKNAKKLTPELGYIIGVVLGDGHIFLNEKKNGHRSGGITLKVKDKDFAEYFASMAERWCNKKPCWYFQIGKWGEILGRRCYFQPSYIVMLNSMEAGKFLKKKLKDLNWIYTTNKEFKRMIVKGLWDSEGSIEKDRCYISFGNSKIEIIELFKRLCLELGIKTGKIIRRSSGFFFIKISNIPNVIRFYNEIGITITRKRRIMEKLNDKYGNL